MPTSRIQTPWAKPVPIALTIASFAAKRMARNRAGRAVRSSCSRSSGISKWSTKRVPCLSCTRSIRSAFSTSMPIPKIIWLPATAFAAGALAARREHQVLHLAHRRGQALEHGARDDRVTDVQLDDLRNRRDGSDVVVIEAMPGVDGQSQGCGNSRARALSFEFAGFESTAGLGIGARMQFDHRGAGPLCRLDLRRIGVYEQGDAYTL